MFGIFDFMITKSFVKVFEEKHVQPSTITYVIDRELKKAIESHILFKIEKLAITSMHALHPELSYVTSFSYRDRTAIVMRYSQAFQYVAFKNGFKKTKIARHVKRNHASVINGIKQARNALFCNSQKFIKIYLTLLEETYHYVGSISTNTRG